MRPLTDATGVPVTTIGGYLGAGKTTLVNGLLAGDHGVRIGVLVNDFGAVSIDEKLIVSRDGDVVALANGCACCSVAGDLASALDRFAGRTDRYDQIVIEASGVADPARISELAQSPGLTRSATIVVADAGSVKTLATDKFVGRLVRRQLAAADIVVMTKIDLLDAHRLEAAQAFAAAEAPRARLLAVSRGRVAPSDLFRHKESARAGRMPVCTPTSPDLASDLFESHFWESREPVNLDILRATVAVLPPTILRIKGIVVTGEGESVALQRAGDTLTVDRLDRAARSAGAEIAIIGQIGTLDRASLDRAFGACLLSSRARP